MQHGRDDGLGDAGEELEDNHVFVARVVRLEWADKLRPIDELLVVADRDASACQRRIVEGVEGVEVVGIDLRGAVAAHELVLEEDADFRHDGLARPILRGGYLDGSDEVLLAVRPQHVDRQLRPGQDDGLIQVLEHEAES